MIKNINIRVSKQLTLMLWCFLPNEALPEALPQHAHNQSVTELAIQYQRILYSGSMHGFCSLVKCYQVPFISDKLAAS